MKTTRRAGMAQSRLRLVFAAACVALLLVAGALLAGCDEDDIQGLPFFTSAVTHAADENEAAKAVEKIEAREAEAGTVMKAEDDSVQLEGKWPWPSLTCDYTESLENPRIYPIEREGEGWTFTIIKKGDGYTTLSDGTVTLKGTSVTITEESGGEGDSISLTGEIKGDTIVGTVHRSVVAKTLSSGVPQGAGEYEGPWTATRIE